jgi:hypothetical protein
MKLKSDMIRGNFRLRKPPVDKKGAVELDVLAGMLSTCDY